MKNVTSGILFKALFLLSALSGAIRAEKVLVVVDGPYYGAMRSSGYAVYQYVSDLTSAGTTVYTAFYYEDAHDVYPVQKANHLYTVIKSYYDTCGIDGVVLIGELPYAPCYDVDALPMIFPNDYFFMDLKDKNDVHPHQLTWNGYRRVDAFIFDPSLCDNTAEIWVSRITAMNIFTSDAVDDYGISATQASLLDQYLWRLHQRMTVAETQPKRFLAAGMENPSSTIAILGFDTLLEKSIPGWVLYDRGVSHRDCLSDLPSNWQAQLQGGPYGTLNAQSGRLDNGFSVLSCDSRTYAGIADDTFGFEWAGVYEHSTPTTNCFQGNESSSVGWFCSTDEIAAGTHSDQNILCYDRSLTGMYSDGGHPKARFFMDAGCSNLAISEGDCEGELYAMLGNGLICFGSTVVHLDANKLDFGIFIKYLANTPGATFGRAFKNLVNTKKFPTHDDVYMLIGAGTLTPDAPMGYVKKNIYASFTTSADTVDDATNDCSGAITFTSKSATDGPYDTGATVYKWYDEGRRFIMETRSSVSYRQTYADTGHITINGRVWSGDIMIEAAQPGFLSGYIQTSVNGIVASVPAITGIATSIVDVHTDGITNWWVDSIPGHIQYDATSNTTTFDKTKALYKWYDKNFAYRTSTAFCTTFSYIGSRDALKINSPPGVAFNGNFFVKAMTGGMRSVISQGENTAAFCKSLRDFFGVSGIQKKIAGGNSTITSFVPTINTLNGTLDVAGTTVDSATTYGCIGGTVFLGTSLAQITAENSLFSGSPSRKAGVYYCAVYPGLHSFYYHSIYLYQSPDNSLHIWHSGFDGIGDTTVATQGYTVGSTWLRITGTTGDSLVCSASTDNSTYTKLYQWPCWGLSGSNCDVGVLYSSGGAAGSARFVNINITKK
jgi:hypothetical protein